MVVTVVVHAQGSEIWGVVGPTDLPPLPIKQQDQNSASPNDRANTEFPVVNPNVVLWGSYPVNTKHLMGEPEFAHVSLGYKIDAPDIWPGLAMRSVCYTGKRVSQMKGGGQLIDQYYLTRHIAGFNSLVWGIRRSRPRNWLNCCKLVSCLCQRLVW